MGWGSPPDRKPGTFLKLPMIGIGQGRPMLIMGRAAVGVLGAYWEKGTDLQLWLVVRSWSWTVEAIVALPHEWGDQGLAKLDPPTNPTQNKNLRLMVAIGGPNRDYWHWVGVHSTGVHSCCRLSTGIAKSTSNKALFGGVIHLLWPPFQI